MPAAVVSLLLLAGACGATPCPCSSEASGTLWSPVTPNGVVTYNSGVFGCPCYSPLWLIHSNQTYYPANYAKPYDYREAFGYPWNGPRPKPLMPSVPMLVPADPGQELPEPSTAATHRASNSTNSWPTATAAKYVRQSQSRIASKPAVGSR